MMIEKRVRILENGRSALANDLAWWLKQPPAARIAAVEEIRRDYHLWRYGAEPGFQRVLRIVERKQVMGELQDLADIEELEREDQPLMTSQ